MSMESYFYINIYQFLEIYENNTHCCSRFQHQEAASKERAIDTRTEGNQSTHNKSNGWL